MEINSIQFKCNFYPTNAALRRFLGRLVCIWTGRFPLLPHPTMMVLVDCGSHPPSAERVEELEESVWSVVR